MVVYSSAGGVGEEERREGIGEGGAVTGTR